MIIIRIIKRIIKTILTKYGFELKRVWKPEDDAYYCSALTGMSGYNISINSDLSVSCSCQDSTGEGIIGKLNGTNTFKSVFLSEKANSMRTDLANGKLPISICSRCQELRVVPKYIAEYYSKHIKMPTNGIMVENCSACNYNCKYCPREQYSATRTSAIISVDNIKYIAHELKENKIKNLILFKSGEPFLDKDIYKKLQILREINPDIYISTSTNGLLINDSEKVAAALMFNYIYFSIDGINTEMQNMYQRGADFDKIMDNVKMIIDRRGNSTMPILAWKYVVFSFNEAKEYINEAFKKAVEIGFDRLIFTESTAPYINNKSKMYFSKRYFVKDFIPKDIKYSLVTYSPGYGMEFDLHKKNDV
jgi:pyruvate-formate lyase-activating enzyme